MRTHHSTFGRMDGLDLEQITLRNATGGEARILSFGAILHSWTAPGRDGRPEELTLGFADPAEYVKANPAYFGAICGRVANRIARGRFTIEGNDHALVCNNGPNHLHGGARGFDRHAWRVAESTPRAVRLHRVSPDGEEGYPGNLDVSVTYTLTDDHILRIEYEAMCDRTTILNLTNHAYFNLSGGQCPDVHTHRLTLSASRYLPSDEHALVTGEILPVEGTPWDFRDGGMLDGRPLGLPTGYDHCFVFDTPGLKECCARLEYPPTGRIVELRTTEPGVHVYTGYYVQGVAGRDGRPLPHSAGVALEAEHFPDAIHHPEFPSILLRRGEAYRQTTEYRAGYLH
ncbi:MAG: galactose mutarotase [Kiritimatiellae bacterium]|nr:galactose mutarotase [Kiritimatiellia bacterium]